MPKLQRYWITILFSVLLLYAGCSSEIDQAQKYYEMGKYDAALNVANKVLAKDRENAEVAALVWKIQIITRYCDDVRKVEYACSSIREMAVPYGNRILEPLKRALKEEEGCIKLFAVYILGNVDSPEVYPILSEIATGNIEPLKEGSSISREMIQGGALVTLGQRGDKVAFPLMVEATKSENGELRAMATEAMGYVGDESTIPILEELLSDPYTVAGKRTVALAASRSLKMITGEDYEID